MNPWEQKLKDSGLLAAVDALNMQLDVYNEAELSIEDRSYLDKIRAVNDVVGEMAVNVDPRLVNYSALQAMVPHLNNIVTYLNSWGGGASPAYLSTHALGQVDNVLQYVSSITPAMNLPEARAAITSLRRSVARQKAVVDAITDKIQERGSLADKAIEEKAAEFSDKIETQAVAIEERLDTINIEAGAVSVQLEEIKLAANKLATEQNETFNTAQTERVKQFEKLLKEQQNEASGVFTSVSQKLMTEVGKVKDRAELSAKLAENARAKSEELLGIVSQNALINDYSKSGLHERKWSRIWQTITLVSLAATVAMGALLALSTNADTSWQKLVARFGVLIATGGLAAYAATQASEHKRAQRHSEHLSLQLSAVRPYLADIDQKSDRDKLLLKLAEKFFSEWKPRERKDLKGKKDAADVGVISGDDLPGLVGAIINIVNATNKK